MSTHKRVRYTLDKGPVRKDQKEFQPKCMLGIAACEGGHLVREAGLLLRRDGEVAAAAAGAVFDLHQQDGVAAGKGEVSLR